MRRSLPVLALPAAGAPGHGDVIRHERSKDGRVAAVSNSRNGFSRKYRIK